ncbi:MAG: copper resistance protein CopC [Chloroflexi bacterium]|nr:copper resistance protein CopC [Chloroflexota bacterium]
MMFHTKFAVLSFVGGVLIFFAAACAPSAAPQVNNAAMAKETDTAMMAKETESAAMMAKETESAAMMAKETDTAMMAKETDTAMMAKETDTAAMAKPTDAAMNQSDAMMPKFPPQQFAAHFVDSMPVHEATLVALPQLVLLNFNFTLSPASTITIEKDGKELKTAPGKLSDNKLAMTAELPVGAGMGLYLVKYKACWPDNSCHTGQFAFYVK